MLAIPTKGFAKSVTRHNNNLDVLADWIEGSLLFQESVEIISQVDVADTLLDDERYVDQEFALEGVKNAWFELRRREQAIGLVHSISIDKRRINKRSTWRDYPAHAFCVLVSLAPYYDWWTVPNYTEQGEIFELITKESFSAQFPDWQVFHTGWTRNNPVRLRDIATTVKDLLGEDPGDMDTWDDPYKKELGLDLLCYRPFLDGRKGIPVFMVQCASGSDWDTKLDTPNLDIWGDIIHFKNRPLRAFSTPFTFQEKLFNQSITSVKGLFFERCRLLSAGNHNEDWLSPELRTKVIDWMEPLVALLLDASQI